MNNRCDRCEGLITGPPFGPPRAQWCDPCWWAHLGGASNPATDQAFAAAVKAAGIELDGEVPETRAEFETALTELRGTLKEAEEALAEAEDERDDRKHELQAAEAFLKQHDTPRAMRQAAGNLLAGASQ